jgi:hypothetical protein
LGCFRFHYNREHNVRCVENHNKYSRLLRVVNVII